MKKQYPKISIIVVNLNGKKIIHHCLDSLKKIDYPKDKLEIIVFDNGSIDGSVNYLKSNYPEVKIISNEKNLGFARPNDMAAKEAKGEYLVFLNNDMRVEEEWLKGLSSKIVGNNKIGTVSSKILSWDGKKIDHGGADSDVFMNARLEGYEEINKGDNFNQDKEILFPSGGSMIIRKDLFLEVGGFDEDFFAYYEDVDLGIRLKIMGYENHFASKSVVYHMHSATSKKIPKEKLRVLQIRNILWIIIKNYSDENLNKFLASALLLSLQRTFDILGNFSSKKYDFLRIESEKTKKIPGHFLRSEEMLALSDLVGYSDLLSNIEKFYKKRKIIQSKRKNDDKEVFKLMKSKYFPIIENGRYSELYSIFLELFKINK